MKSPLSKPTAVIGFLRGFRAAVARAVFLCCAGLGNAFGMDYYVDGLRGSDDADGKAVVPAGAAGPWKTLSKVNAMTFLPGDKI